ncbi:MAG: UDP-glucose 4-epimerase GalE [Planctomycetes bacterium]|nr:UDP-glucose 4-epimerase GalE [Planctomycetota bacterium]MBI5739882.1 UDP-glucose 4-epimerase GalE [Nitrospirota bacterium]
MKVLVTGGAGYVGSVVVEMLLKERFSVSVIDNIVEGHRSAIPADIPFFEADIGTRDYVRKILGSNQIDAVIHMAGETLVSKSMSHPQDYFLGNVSKGLELLEAMRESNVKRIIFSSTAALFGNPEYTPIDEKHPTNPINAYGRSKLMFEQMLDWYHKAHGLNYVCLRYFNAAGATVEHGEHHRIETHLIPIVLQTALGQRDHVDIYGNNYDTRDGTCIRDYIHVEDLAMAHIEALRRMDDIGPQKLNLGNGEGYSVKEVIEAAREITGHPIPAREADRRSGDPAVLVASSERTRSLLGLKPRYPEIRQIVRTAWDWHSRNHHGYPD